MTGKPLPVATPNSMGASSTSRKTFPNARLPAAPPGLKLQEKFRIIVLPSGTPFFLPPQLCGARNAVSISQATFRQP